MAQQITDAINRARNAPLRLMRGNGTGARA